MGGVILAQKPGRPRSEETRKTILATAYKMLIEEGFTTVTVEEIAKRAGVSKATIYKWWPNKAAVVLDGFFEATANLLPIPDTGSVKEDLFIQVNNLTSFFLSSKGKGITELIAAGQFDSSIAEEFRKRYIIPRRQITRSLIERGIDKGQLTRDIDIDLLIDMLYAPTFYRILITGESINEEYIHKVLNQTLKDSLL